jgi:succinylarginine dihydrolase
MGKEDGALLHLQVCAPVCQAKQGLPLKTCTTLPILNSMVMVNFVCIDVREKLENYGRPICIRNRPVLND